MSELRRKKALEEVKNCCQKYRFSLVGNTKIIATNTRLEWDVLIRRNLCGFAEIYMPLKDLHRPDARDNEESQDLVWETERDVPCAVRELKVPFATPC